MSNINQPRGPSSSLVDADDETMPEEDYNRILGEINKGQTRSTKENSSFDEQIGPNVNLKYFKKRWSTEEEKLYLLKKIKAKKKTELCKNWEVCHQCYFGSGCSFAHGKEELRQQEENLSPYKVKFCKSFSEKGYCNFGLRCGYRHIFKEKRLFSYDFIVRNTAAKVVEECRKSEKLEKREDVLTVYVRLMLKIKIDV